MKVSHALEAICGVYADLGMVCRSAVEILSKQRTPRRLLCYSHHFSRDPSRSSGSHGSPLHYCVHSQSYLSEGPPSEGSNAAGTPDSVVMTSRRVQRFVGSTTHMRSQTEPRTETSASTSDRC